MVNTLVQNKIFNVYFVVVTLIVFGYAIIRLYLVQIFTVSTKIKDFFKIPLDSDTCVNGIQYVTTKLNNKV